MNWDLYFIDAAALGVLIYVFYKGFRVGVVNQVVWLASFLIAYFAAAWLSYDIADLAGIEIGGERLTLILWFAVVFAVVVVGVQALGRWLTRAVSLTPAGPLNAILGGTLNSLLYITLLLVVVNVGVVSIPKLDEYLEKTITLDPVVQVEKWVMDSRVVKKLADTVNDLND